MLLGMHALRRRTELDHGSKRLNDVRLVSIYLRPKGKVNPNARWKSGYVAFSRSLLRVVIDVNESVTLQVRLGILTDI